MDQITFLLLTLAIMGFIYTMFQKIPDECKAFVSRLTGLVPEFEGEKADTRSLVFCGMCMVFALGVLMIIFG